MDIKYLLLNPSDQSNFHSITCLRKYSASLLLRAPPDWHPESHFSAELKDVNPKLISDHRPIELPLAWMTKTRTFHLDVIRHDLGTQEVINKEEASREWNYGLNLNSKLLLGRQGLKKMSEVYRRRKLDIKQTTKSDAIDSECERVTGVVATH